MPIRIARTTQPLNQRPFQPGGSVVPVPAIGNPAAAAVRPAQQAAGLAAQIFQEQRDREIVTRVSELDIQRRKSDADVVDGYRSLQGKDAVEQRAAAMAAISANARTVKEGIQDREVAGIWARQDAELTLAAQQQLDTHYRQQNTRWQADTQDARASLLVNDLGRAALGDGYNPATGQLSVEAERSRSAYHDAIGEMGSILGWGKEQVEVARRKADTQAYGQVAESLIRQERYGEASKVLERHGDRIDVGTRDQLAQQARVGAAQQQDLMRRSAVADQSTQLALQLVEGDRPTLRSSGPVVFEFRGPVDVDTMVPRAVAKLDQMFLGKQISAELRDATVTRIGADFERRKAAQTVAETKALEVAKIEAQTNRSGYATLSPEAQQKLDASPLARAKFDLWELQGNQDITTAKGTQALLLMPDAELDRYQSEEEIRRKWDFEMAPAELGKFVDRWKALKTGKQAPDAWVTEAVRIAALDAGLLPSAMSGNQGLTEQDSSRLLRMMHAVKNTAAKGDGVASRADIDAAIKKEFGATIVDVAGNRRVVASMSPDELSTAVWSGSTGGTAQLSAVDDARRAAAVDRLKRQAEDDAAWNAANPTRPKRQIASPDNPQAFVDALIQLRRDEKQAAVEKARQDARDMLAEQDRRDQMWRDLAAKNAKERAANWAAFKDRLSAFGNWLTNGEDVIDPNLLRNVIGIPNPQPLPSQSAPPAGGGK